MAFSLNYTNVNDLLPEGTYEALITTAAEEADKQGRTRLNFALVVRNDVDQPAQNRTIFHSMYKVREPDADDQMTENYKFSALMRIAKSAGLPEDKPYQSVSQMVADTVNRPVRIEVAHETYDGKKSARVKYWNESEFPQVSHRIGGKSQPAQSYAPQSSGVPASALAHPSASALPWN